MPMDPGPLGPVVQGMPTGLSPAVYAPAPTDEDDLLHEELHGEVEAEDLGSNENVASPTSSAKEGDVVAQAAADESDHLQPGGVGSGVTEQLVPDNVSKGSTLDGMTLKELRRLGEQRGIAKAATMSKQKLIDAVRALPNVITPYEAGDSTLDLS